MPKCEFCGKYMTRNFYRHVSTCIKNPNATLSNTGKIKAERESRRNSDGTLKRLVFRHSEDSKKRISESRKKWMSENKDKHVWRKNSKFVSEPCENLKKYLLSKGINFVEEYEPFNDNSFCIDIAWPDIKVGIEVNGNQHYNRDGSLKKYYSDRHKLFEERGWKIFELHYTKCYNISIDDLHDILSLSIYDKNYVGQYFSRQEKRQQKKDNIRKKREEKHLQTEKKKHELYIKNRNILISLTINSGINFSRHWSSKAKEYLSSRNELFDINIFRAFKKYYPEFLLHDFVYKRNGSKI